MSLFEKYKQGDKNSNLIDKLSSKSEMKNNDSLSIELYSIILNNESEYASSVTERAVFYFAKLSLKEGNINKMNNFIVSYKESSRIGDAYNQLAYYYKTNKDTLLEVNTLKKMLDEFPDSPSLLNRYAWRMTEVNKELNDALEKINTGLSLTEKTDSSYPALLDTKAEVLWKMDLFDEAIKVIDEAINIDKESEYYNKQKKKFQESKSKIKVNSI